MICPLPPPQMLPFYVLLLRYCYTFLAPFLSSFRDLILYYTSRVNVTTAPKGLNVKAICLFLDGHTPFFYMNDCCFKLPILLPLLFFAAKYTMDCYILIIAISAA